MSTGRDSNDGDARGAADQLRARAAQVPEDPEDRATELWAPVARDLFRDELLAKVLRNAGGPAVGQLDSPSRPAAPAPAAREPEIQAPPAAEPSPTAPEPAKQAPPAAEPVPVAPEAAQQPRPAAASHPAFDPHDSTTSPGFEPAAKHSQPAVRRPSAAEARAAAAGVEPEELPTLPEEPEDAPTRPVEPEEDPTLPEALLANQSVSGELEVSAGSEPEDLDTEQTPVMVDGMDGETINMTPQQRGAYGLPELTPEQEQAFARAQDEANRLMSESVEVTGEEGQAARILREEMARRAEDDTESTVIVETPNYVRPVPHECRICGHKIAKPRKRRFRGPINSVNGFHCEECHNVFCATHVERVSGLLESVFRGARFRCLLCVEEARPRR